MYENARPHKRPLCQRGRARRPGDCLAVGGRFRGGSWGRGIPSGRAWRRGHLPLTREANSGGGPRPTGEPHLCGIASPCRGRCSHRPGDLAPPQCPREGHGPPLQTMANVAAKRVGRHHPGGRRAGCPHPAGPHGGANIPVLNRCGAAGVNARPTERGEHRGQPKTLRCRKHPREG